MKSIFTILLAITISFPILSQNRKLTVQKHSVLGVKNIVITEKTYNELTNRTLNKRKLAKIADKEAGKPKRADDPIARALYERNILKNPLTGQIPLNIKELEKAYVLSSASGLQSRLKTGGLSYTNSGPRNVGGRTRALAVDIANENIILAGGITGGMWKSTDNGASWTRTTKLEDHPSVTSIAQDPNNTAIWYYTTGELIGNSASEGGAPYRGNGLFKSTDNGDNWTSLTSTTSNTSEVYDPFDYAWNICVDPNNSDVYVATADGIKRSTDGGTSWTDVIESDSYYEDIICTPGGIKYASLSADGTTKGIYRSSTGNLNDWEDITPSGFPADYNRVVLAHATSNTTNDIVYILGETTGAGFQNHSFWKLTYNSSATTPATWVDRSQNLPEGGDGDTDVNGYNSQGSYNMVIKVAPDNENMVFIGGTNLLRSDDAFATKASPLSVGKSTDKSKTYWIGGYATENNVTQYPNHHPDVHALVFKNDNATLLCGHDGGISITNNYKQTDDTFSEPASEGDKSMPVDWEFLNNGYLTTQAYTVAVDNDIRTNKVLLSGFQDNGTWLAETSDSDQDWLAWGSGDGSYCSIFNLGNSLLTSSQSGTTYLEDNVTDEASYYWTRVDPEGATGQLFINPFIEDANNSEILYYAAGQYIWRNSNVFEIPKLQPNEATKNWEKLEISKASGTVSAMESSTFPAHILYYGTSTGKVYKIENSHSKWAKNTDITGTNMPAGNVISIDANPLNANEVLVGFSNYGIESIFNTTDGGTSWTPVSGNLEEINGTNNGPSVRSVAFMVSPTDTTYYAGTSTGLYSTTKLEGSSTIWTQQAINQIGTSVVSMIKARRDGFFAVATHGNGIFTADDDFSSAAPVALIGMTQDTIYKDDAINFMNRTIGDGITSWEWTFEGATPNTSLEEHPRDIAYNTAGTFKVSLKAKNSAGENIQEIVSAIVVKSVKAAFTASSTNVNVGTEVTFTDQSAGTPTSWNWSFPGGAPESSTEQNPVVTYSTVGTYNVKLTVGGESFNDTETKTAYITVLDADDFGDQLLYNVTDTDESKLSIYSFNGATSWGYTAGHNSYNMSQFAEKFEMVNPNLNVVRSIQLNPVIIEQKSSDPKIALKIWNGESLPETEIYSKEIAFSELQAQQFNEIILDSPIEVNSSFFVGYEVFYENPVDTFAVYHLPLDGDITWDNSAYLTYEGEWKSFSDGNIYAANSALAIKALVGYEENIAPPLKADFTANSTTTTTADNISFTDLSTGEIASWEWNFAGGTADDNTMQNPTVSYSEAGIYDVTLKVIGTNGTSNTNTKENYITVEMATAINELGEEVEKLMIYPNPLVNKSNVVFPNKTNQKYRLVVVDASGRVVRIIENITGDNVIINREQLKPGVHIINLSGEKIYKGKLLVK